MSVQYHVAYFLRHEIPWRFCCLLMIPYALRRYGVEPTAVLFSFLYIICSQSNTFKLEIRSPMMCNMRDWAERVMDIE